MKKKIVDEIIAEEIEQEKIEEPKAEDLETEIIAPETEIIEPIKEKKTVGSFFKNLFRKKEKAPKLDAEVTPEITKPEKTKMQRFWSLFTAFATTVIFCVGATVLGYYLVEKSDKKAEEARQHTIYNIGNIEVPSFEYVTSSPVVIGIEDTKDLGATYKTQTVVYTIQYDTEASLNADKSEYITALLNNSFIVTNSVLDVPTELTRSFEGIILKVTFNSSVNGEKFLLNINYNRNI